MMKRERERGRKRVAIKREYSSSSCVVAVVVAAVVVVVVVATTVGNYSKPLWKQASKQEEANKQWL